MNDKKNLLVITSYPTKGSIFGKGISGLASFAKNTVNSIKENFKVTVFAEENGEEPFYMEEGVSVKRIWKRHSKFLSFQFISELLKYSRKETIVLLEFELATFGSNFTTGLLSMFYLISKLLGYKIVTVMHQVIIDINTLSTHLGLQEGSFKTKVINFLLINLTRLIVKYSWKVVVLDEVHKQKLNKIANIKNVFVIPHGVETKELTIKPEPHNKINVLYFGHITWYKGADWLVKSYLEFEKTKPDDASRLFIKLAGGMSPTQRENPAYIKYYTELEKLASQSTNIEITGYVEENDFERLFAYADIQILPYRALMSSSGPLSHAFEYEKPVLISNVIAPYLDTYDIKEIMEEMSLSNKDLVFELEKPQQLFEIILKFTRDEISKRKEFAKSVREARNWENIGKKYLEVTAE